MNTRYLDPFGAHPRDHDQYVFFEAGNRRVVALPPSLTAAAGCEAIFRLIWSSASSGAASDIVGDTVEKSVAIACRAHTDCVWQKVAYLAGGKNFEIDAAVRDGDEIVVFESKAKSLTSKARTGDMMAFIDDYTKSFLALVGQLVRHDQNIERGLTPLTRDDEDLDALRITKIAVSPLSYGPGSDHLLANALLNSIVHARLASVQEDPHHNRILKAFNQKLDQITRDIATAAPKEHGEIDLFGYFIDLFWLDLGQLLYSLHRGRSVSRCRFCTAAPYVRDTGLLDRGGIRRPSRAHRREMASDCRRRGSSLNRLPTRSSAAAPLPIGTIVPRIEAGIVEVPIHPDPAHALDTATRCRVRVAGKCRHDLQPLPGAPGDVPDLPRDFGQILILAG